MLHRILALFTRDTPTHCACGAPALVYDAERGYCWPCYRKTNGG